MAHHVIGLVTFRSCAANKMMRLREFSIHDWLGPASRTLPTTDLYFLNACHHWLDNSPFKSGPIRRIGANSFVSGDVTIVSRKERKAIVDKLLRRKDRRLFYIIDDNLWAAEEDATLPEDYRRRLIELRDGQHRALCKRADTIIVSTKPLADIYTAQGHKVVQLSPYWSDPIADHSHFEDLNTGARLEIGYLGSGTHAADRAFVVSVFEKLSAQGLDARLTMIGTRGVPDRIVNDARFRSLKNLRWPLYRKRLAKLRFHFLLYPILPSMFNQSRSINKVIEHAIVGGVGIYSDSWFCAEEIRDNAAGVVRTNDADLWTDTIMEHKNLIETGFLRSVSDFAKSQNQQNMEKQLRFWQSVLKL
ncbi:MAG: hypothetical protein RDA78_14450 [Roseibium sp.]|uniref:hypothetical protein n=1 Tax=Roseibium sp. TaxID=1936156 RepID=UPI003D9C6717